MPACPWYDNALRRVVRMLSRRPPIRLITCCWAAWWFCRRCYPTRTRLCESTKASFTACQGMGTRRQGKQGGEDVQGHQLRSCHRVHKRSVHHDSKASTCTAWYVVVCCYCNAAHTTPRAPRRLILFSLRQCSPPPVAVAGGRV
jgi:hypothetical protein